MTAIGNSTPVKTCTKCGEGKPATNEFFHKKLKSLVPLCIVCTREKVLAQAPIRKEKRDLRAARRNLARALLRIVLSKQPAVQPVDMVCSICSQTHPISKEFYGFDVRRNRWTKHCRECQRAMCKAHYEKNKEAYHARARAFEKANPEWQSRRNKKYREDNSGKILSRLRDRHRADPVYRMKRIVSTSIAGTLRRSGFTKRSKVVEILGCTWDELKQHFERQFLKGMSWDNRELWHIDHIVPIASASTEEEVIRLNHFTNLRPIWAKDNLSKGAQITHLI